MESFQMEPNRYRWRNPLQKSRPGKEQWGNDAASGRFGNHLSIHSFTSIPFDAVRCGTGRSHNDINLNQFYR
jgi:hypothetical protein